MPLNPFSLIGIGAGLIGSVGKAIFGSRQQREAKKINPVWSPYQASPYATKQVQLATNAFNDPSFGTRPQIERNLQTAGANFNAGVAKTATDQAQELALLSSGLGATDNAISNYGLDLTKNKMGLLGNLNEAYGQMINEGNKVYQSQEEKYKMDMAQKQALLEGAAQNKFSAAGDLASLGIYSGQLYGGNQSSLPPSRYRRQPITSWKQLQGDVNIDTSQIGR